MRVGFEPLAYTTPPISFISSNPPPCGSVATSDFKIFVVLVDVSMVIISGFASSLLLTHTVVPL